MTNQVLLIGRLGGDPEIRTTRGGDRVASFSVATTESWRDRQTGEKKTATEWHNVETFVEATVNFLEKYAGKGDLVKVQGKIKTDKYEKDGVKQQRTKVVVGGRFTGIDLLQSAKPNGAGQAANNAAEDHSADLDDEIPF